VSDTFHDQLRERAAAYSHQWRPSVTDEAEVGLVTTQVARRRRGRVLAAASALCLVVIGVGVVAAMGRGEPVRPATPAPPHGLEVLGTAGPSDAILTVSDTEGQRIVIAHAHAREVEQVTGAAVREALGVGAAEWPSVTLVATQPSLARAVFVLSDPHGNRQPQLALYTWTTGDTHVLDPCTEVLNSLDASRWCTNGADVVQGPGDPPQYTRCVGSGVVLGTVTSMVCATAQGERFLELRDGASADAITMPLGPGNLTGPWVVGQSIFVNMTTTEGDPILVTSAGMDVAVGGAPAAGLGVVDGRLLIRTSSDAYGARSTYGRALGLWDPATAQFEEWTQMPMGPEAAVTFVDVLN